MAQKEYFYVRINPELADVADDEAIVREARLSDEELQKLMAEAAEDRTLMRQVEAEVNRRNVDAYGAIDRVHAFGREFIGGGGEVIETSEKNALEAGKDGCADDGTPLLVVLGKVGEEEQIHAEVGAAAGTQLSGGEA